MKIACDACGAKYSISDDKVRGKVFKIRCKKCSNVIVVRGVEAPAPVVVAPPPDDDRVWHLVVHDDQIGPLTVDEVRTRFLAGDVDGETYTWREGQADWLPLATIEELATITAPQALPVTPELIAESNVAKLRGERNESSVLFSLGNLAQIATRAPARASTSAGLETHASTQEGSGLIDIRSMASAYLGSGMTAKPAASIGSIDDLPVFNTGTAFSEPAVLVASPVRATPSKVMYVMIAAIVAFAAVAIVLLVMLMRRDPTPVTAVAPPVVAITEPPTPPPVAPVPPPPAPVEVQHVTPPPEPPAKQQAPKVRPKAAALAPAAALPKQASAKKSDDCDDIFCVVNSDAACCKSRAPKAAPKQPPPPPPKSDLPEQLTSSMIATAMNAVKARAMACGDKSSAKGRVLVHLKVGNDGRVSDVKVLASPDDALGACVVAVVNRATFPATQSGRSFSVPYTF
jgi:TonB family protein